MRCTILLFELQGKRDCEGAKGVHGDVIGDSGGGSGHCGVDGCGRSGSTPRVLGGALGGTEVDVAEFRFEIKLIAVRGFCTESRGALFSGARHSAPAR
jgi:hypothetical protein